jgi:hypothetical protein
MKLRPRLPPVKGAFDFDDRTALRPCIFREGQMDRKRERERKRNEATVSTSIQATGCVKRTSAEVTPRAGARAARVNSLASPTRVKTAAPRYEAFARGRKPLRREKRTRDIKTNAKSYDATTHT